MLGDGTGEVALEHARTLKLITIVNSDYPNCVFSMKKRLLSSKQDR